MSFTTIHLQLGSKQPVHKYQLCNKCEEMRPPEGGIQMSAAKWICACCWTKRVTTRNLLEHAKTQTTRTTDRKTSEDV
jgi:hypothetical protein